MILISPFNIHSAPAPIVQELYFNLISGHLHQGPSSDSSSLKVLSCGDRLKVIPNEKEITSTTRFSWTKLQVATYSGYVRTDFLVSELPNCFNNKYLKFFEQFKVDINDKYNWGRLYDNYVWGKSKVK